MSTSVASEPRSTSRSEIVGVVATVVVWAVATALIAVALHEPAHVDRITVENPHPWHVNVDVTGGDRRGWIDVGGLERDDDHAFGPVLDQGDTWIFRFAYGGEHIELRVSRRQLEQDDWHVTVPDDLAERLRTVGMPESSP